MAEMIAHGAGCCGMRHIYRLGTGRDVDIRAFGQAWDLYQNSLREHGGNILCEVVLTDDQLNGNNGALVHELRAKNFRRVTRFRNSNSGNNCSIFHYVPNRIALNNDEPWQRHRQARRG